MPSLLHEALVELFRRRITLAPEVLSEALGVALPEFTEARGETVDFTQIIPTEYRADLVVLLLDGRPVLAIVVEVQLSRDLDKRRSWPVYVTTLRARFDCPACLLVVCSDAETARWCASPIEIGHEGFALRPYVLGPGSVPVVTEAKRAQAAPELAVLSALAHGKGERGLEVAVAAVAAAAGLDEGRALFYTDLVLSALPEAARCALEELMSSGTYQYQSEFARKYYGQGLIEGEAKGEAKGILVVLENRGVAISEAQQQTIRSCQDLGQLDRWLRRALTISEIGELFD